MTSRIEIILNVAADWADDQRRLYQSRFLDPELAALAKRSKEKADHAYEMATQVDGWNDPDGLMDKFFSAAVDYFRLNLHQKRGVIQNALKEPEDLKTRWLQLKYQISKTSDKSEVIMLLSSSPLILEKDWVFELQEARDLYADHEFRDEAVARIEENAEADFDRLYGEAVVYERIGQEFAVSHFGQRTGKKIKWAGGGNDLNIYRAVHTGRILESANEQLLKIGEAKGTSTELVRILLSRNFSSLSAPKSENLRWAIDEGFEAGNIDVPAFLNSISAGRRQLKAEGLPGE